MSVLKRFFQGIEQAFSSFAGPARQAISDAEATCLLSSCLLLYFPVAELQARGRASGLPKVSGQQAASPPAAGRETQHPIARTGESWAVYRIMNFQYLIQHLYTQ